LIVISARPCPKEAGLYWLVSASAIAYLTIFKIFVKTFHAMVLPFPADLIDKSLSIVYGFPYEDHVEHQRFRDERAQAGSGQARMYHVGTG